MTPLKIKSSSVWLILYVAIAVCVYLPLFFFSIGVYHDQRARGLPENMSYPVNDHDQSRYVDIADNIIAHHTFSGKTSAPFTTDTFRTPGLPAVLAVWKLVFQSYITFPLLQIFLAVIGAFLIFRIGEKLYYPKVGGYAGLLFLIDPNTIYHTLVVQTDLLNAFVVILIFYLFCVSEKRSTKIWALMFGLLIGYSTLVRPISMFLIVFFVPFYWYFERGLGWKKLTINLLLFLFGFAILLTPWVIRNKVQTGVAGISSVKDYNFFTYYIPSYLAYKQGTSVEIAKAGLFKEVVPLTETETFSLEYSPQINAVWMKHLKEDPFGYAWFHLIKTLPVFLSSGTKAFLEGYGYMMGVTLYTSPGNMTDLLIHLEIRQLFTELMKNPWIMVEEIGLVLICLLAFLAIFFKKNRPYTILLIGIILYFALLTGTVAYSRFRLPISPFLFLLSLFTLSQIRVFFRNKYLHR